MALNTIDAAGEKDVAIPPEVRFYFFAGTQHSGGDVLKQAPFVQPKPPAACQLPANTNSFFPMQRALLAALREWVVNGKEPPASVYPTIANKSLVPVAQIKFPLRAGIGRFSARGSLRNACISTAGRPFMRLDIAGVMAEPPHAGAAYPLLLPQVDADGNHIDGLRNTAVQVPLGTYAGWNVRKAGLQRGRFLRSARRLTFRSSAPRRNVRRPRTRGRRWKSAIPRTTPMWRKSSPPRRNWSPTASCSPRTPNCLSPRPRRLRFPERPTFEASYRPGRNG